ncbi:MAG: ATPase [Solirubrobacterales bacterium]
MDVISLLEYLEEIIETSPKVPVTGKIMINKTEILDIVDQIVNYLPEELKRAKWVCEEKDRILSEAVEQAEKLKQENLELLRKQIENHNITKEAKLKAEEIELQALRNAKTMRLNAKDYANSILSQLEYEIDQKGQMLLDNMKKDMESFIINLENDINIKGNTIRENIKELREFK